MRTTILLLSAALALGLTTRDAAACGGCFSPQPAMLGDASTTQNGTVVTDHRMVLAITSQGTTLWDQIEYAGDPAEFAWVLPIAGTAAVGLGSDEFITALDDKTTPHVSAPQVYCNPPPGSGRSSSGMNCACGAMSSSDDSAGTAFGPGLDAGAEDDGVTVTRRESVGPYDTVQLRGDGGESIIAWLRKNGFDVPTDIEPMVQKYVDEKFGFLAVRLRPGVGVRAMKPIRVSWSGKNPSLPLRMVAAGVASSVGLKLFVIGDGRWRPQNFDSFTIRSDELSWDFAAQRSTYAAVRDAKAKSSDGRAWAIESSIDVLRYDLPAGASEPPLDAGASGDGGTVDGGDVPDIPPSSSDVEVAFHDNPRERVTRLRADLPVRHLDVDLQLEADVDQSTISPEYHVAKYTNADKLCANGIAYSTPASLAGPLPNDTRASACSVADARAPVRVSLVGLASLALFGLLRRAGRRVSRGETQSRRR